MGILRNHAVRCIIGCRERKEAESRRLGLTRGTYFSVAVVGYDFLDGIGHLKPEKARNFILISAGYEGTNTRTSFSLVKVG
jgi:hypothetical protein